MPRPSSWCLIVLAVHSPEGVKALWALSFDDDNKERIIQESGMIKRLMELSKSSDADIKKSAMGVMWILRYNLKDKKDYQELGEKGELCRIWL